MEVCYRVFAGKEFEWAVGLIYLIGFFWRWICLMERVSLLGCGFLLFEVEFGICIYGENGFGGIHNLQWSFLIGKVFHVRSV